MLEMTLPRTAMSGFTIVDDDGVIVLASARAMRARYATEPFDYDFPKALLSGMASETLCAWYSGGEDEYAIVVEGDASDLFTFAATTVDMIEFTLRLEERDELLLLAYSAFSLACDARGIAEIVPGLSAVVGTFEPGAYEVRVARRPQQRTSFIVAVRLAIAVRRLAERGELPGWRE